MQKENKNHNHAWHSLSNSAVTEILGVNIGKGIKQKDVKKRQARYGKNKLAKKEKFSALKTFLGQFNSPLVYVLIFAGSVMVFIKEWADVSVIFGAVFINAIFGYWEERKTLKILDKLKKNLDSKCVVIRDGNKKQINQAEIVVGDLVVLSPGDKILADGRIIDANNLTISQATLTGEWMAETKNVLKISKEVAMADRDNMAYASCLVEGGLGKMVVTEVGEETEIGKIASMVGGTEKETSPLRKKISNFSKKIGIAIGIISLLIIVGGVMRGEGFIRMFETAVAVAVGGVPEALPIVVTVILAIGMDRLLKKKGLVRKLSSVETLSSTSIICFDKTKTLTQGKMKRAALVTDDKELALKICALANDAFVENPSSAIKGWKIIGNATDKALFFAGKKEGILKTKLEKQGYVEYSRIPFDSKTKYQASLRRNKNENEIMIAGAPEVLLSKAKNVEGWGGKVRDLSDKGYRVVGLGYKKISKSRKKISFQDIEKITFMGLIAFEDPLRPGIKKTIKMIKGAGIQPIIITGDYRKTAIEIARRAGIEVQEDEVVQGVELDEMNDEQLEKNVGKYKIYARTEPRQKIRIVKAWQANGRAVGMVGDGVNDSPAIKGADIGISLGSATEAAKEAADLILLNDDFNIIVEAIRESRIILDNMKKSISYVLADSFTSVILVGTSKVILGWPLPILPVQILWNNIVEDTLPDISYAFEPGDKGVLRRKPISLKKPLLDRRMKVLIFGTGLIDEFLTLLLFWYLYFKIGADLEYVRTMVFGAISIDTAFVIYSYKNMGKNIWNIKLFNNRLLTISSGVVLLAFVCAVYVPFFQKILHTVSLGWTDWILLLSIGFVSLTLIELTKWFFIVKREKRK